MAPELPGRVKPLQTCLLESIFLDGLGEKGTRKARGRELQQVRRGRARVSDKAEVISLGSVLDQSVQGRRKRIGRDGEREASTGMGRSRRWEQEGRLILSSRRQSCEIRSKKKLRK